MKLPTLALLIAAPVLIAATPGLPWYKMQGDREAQRVLLITTAVLCAARWMSVEMMDQLSVHFIGASIATLMFGARFALWVMAVVSLVAWIGTQAWLDWASDFIASGLIPIALTTLVSRLAVRYLPPNIVVYIMFNAFFAGAVAMAGAMLFKAWMVSLLVPDVAHWYVLVTPLLMFGEAFFTGAAMALIVVYRPQWCSTFDDARYLHGPRR